MAVAGSTVERRATRWGLFLGIAVVVAVFAGSGGYTSPGDFVDGFEPAILVAGGLALAGALAGTMLPSRRRAPREAGLVPALEGG